MSDTAGARHFNPRIAGWSLAGALLLAPLLATQFTTAVNWGAEDFIAAATLLGGAGLAIEATIRLVRGTAARIMLGSAILAGVSLIWAHLAIGVF